MKWINVNREDEKTLPPPNVQVFAKHTKGRKDVVVYNPNVNPSWPHWAEYWLDESSPHEGVREDGKVDEMRKVSKKQLIDYIYEFAWMWGRFFHLEDAEKIKEAVNERFQLPEEFLTSPNKWIDDSPTPSKQEDGELYEAGQIDALVKDFNKAVNALALEIPQLVWVVFKSKWMKLNSIIQSKQNKSGVDMILSEPETLKRLDKMCIESLPPNYFEKWEQIKNLLIKTRKNLKDAKDSNGLND